MKQIRIPISMERNPLELSYDRKEILYFDIETTGLSASCSYVYLIGCIAVFEEQLYLFQWFSESIEQERDLLLQFFSFAKNYSVLVHYNGSSFDLPFLSKRAIHHHLSFQPCLYESFDLYKVLKPYKNLLNLTNLRQKTIEELLGIKRKDRCSGSDLITMYARYVGISHFEKLNALSNTKTCSISNDSGLPSLCCVTSESLLELLLLHNQEDLLGLYQSMMMLAYTDLTKGKLTDISMRLDTAYCTISFQLLTPIPNPIHETRDLALLTFASLKESYVLSYHIEGTKGLIMLPYLSNTLKHYFTNYQDYEYLPIEDIAIHKSVAAFVDKGYRKKAKPDTCYTKKEDFFLPQGVSFLQPDFRLAYKDTFLWVQKSIIEDLFLSKEKEDLKPSYVSALLTLLTSIK